MIDATKIRELAQENLTRDDLFLVDVRVSPAGEIELTIDSDGSVSVDDCVALSRTLEEILDRDEEDFSLTVSSAGIGQPLRLLRQYRKLVGSPLEVVLVNGTKIRAKLTAADEEGIELSYSEKVAVPGKKRKEEIEVVKRYAFTEIKTAVEYLDFK